MTNKLTYPEKRALYENIMKKIAKQVKNMLNESYSNDESKRYYAMYDSKYNKVFAEERKDLFKMSDNKISTKINIVGTFNEKDEASIMLTADNVGLLMQKLTILLYGEISGPLNNDYEVHITNDLKKFWKTWNFQFTDFHKNKEYKEFEEADTLIEDLGWGIFNDNSNKNARQIAIELYKFNQEKMNNLKVNPE